MTDEEIETLASDLEEFLFLKFQLKDEQLIKAIESEKWKKKLKLAGSKNIIQALSLLQARQQKEEIALIKGLEKDLEESKLQNENIKAEEQNQPMLDHGYSMKCGHGEDAVLMIIDTKDEPRIKEPKETPETQIVTVKLPFDKKNEILKNFYLPLKAAAIFPFECDPVDISESRLAFQFRHIHNQLAISSQFGSWDAHYYIRILGSYCFLDIDHPIRANWKNEDPWLASGGTYRTFKIYSPYIKKPLKTITQSDFKSSDHIDIEEMDEKEKDEYMMLLYNIECGKAQPF